MKCDQAGCDQIAVVGSPSGSYCFEHSGQSEAPTDTSGADVEVTHEQVTPVNEEE